MLFRHAFLLALIVHCSPFVVAAQEPATQPVDVPPAPPLVPIVQSVKPATQPVSDAQLGTWFADLAAADAAVRERAEQALLGLSRSELPGLRRVIERSRPVAPSQAHALRDIVTHVYLSGEPYPGDPSIGFLGVVRPTLDAVEVQRGLEVGPAEDLGGMLVLRRRPNTGIPIEHRVAGFCAFRALRDGDVVLGIIHPTPRRLRDWIELTPTIRSFPAGTALKLEVLRQGVTRTIPVTLDAKPDMDENDEHWHAHVLPKREADAEAYWNEHFAPLVNERMTQGVDAPADAQVRGE